ncbi:MAG: DUF3786 domain-containing protein [Fusicatenibacter sp.]|nr:DUF3786 domain-containing protein [Lachnospiraceae bacterium]MDY2938140.1 DUF3786 domain-containing protein [Fusicatenibacter sp.]
MAAEFNYEKDSKERIPFEHYLQLYQNADPKEIAVRCAVPYQEETQTFIIHLMGVTYEVRWPEYEIRHIDDLGKDGKQISWYPLEEKANARILILRYLTEGGAAPSTGKFLTYRQVPWGEVYFKQFQGRCLFRLAFGFGSKLEQFSKVMERIGAKPIKNGDAGYELEFMDHLYIQLMLWAPDEEFPPSAQILFSDNFPVAFTQGEDMAVVGDVTIDMIKALSTKV